MKFIYEDLLKTIGEFGPWQMKMMFLLWIPMFMCGMQWVTMDFMVLGPQELYCHYEGCESYMEIFMDGSLISKDKLKKYENIFPEVMKVYGGLDKSSMAAGMSLSDPFCTIYIPNNENGYCHWNISTKMKNKTYKCSSVEGDGFEYPVDFQFKTLVTEFDLHCDFWTGRIYFSASSAAGSFLGSIVIAMLADRIGRRPSMLISMLTMSSGAILQTLMPDFNFVVSMTFLKRFGKWALSQVCWLYLVEIMGFKKRFERCYWISYNSVAGLSLMIPYCLGKIFATFFISYFPDWREFEFNLGIISLAQVFVFWVIPESPKWLLDHYKLRTAQKLLSQIAKTNGVDVDIEVKTIKRQKDYDTEGAQSKDDLIEISFGDPELETVLLQQKNYSVKKMCVPETIQYTVAFIWCWPMINFLRFGLVEAGQVFHEPIRTSYIKSGIEIVGILFTCFFEGFMGRRTALLTFLSLTTIMYFGISIRGLPRPVKSSMIHAASFTSISANVLILLFTLSVYPSSLRSKTFGLFTAWSSLGEILAPLLIEYVPHITKKQEGSFFAMGLAALIGGCLCYYLPETLGRPLPETMEDVLYLRARNPSCCSRIKYERDNNRQNVVFVETAPRIKIPNYDWAPTEEIKQWRKEKFGVNQSNPAFNRAEIRRQTLLARK